jgi:KipI family sensor histidine kinase inhibitor
MELAGDVVPVGDAAVLAVLGDSVDEETLPRVWSLAAALRAMLGDSILDVAPAFASVLVRFDPSVARLATIMACVRGALENENVTREASTRLVDVRVCFDPEFGLDLSDVARHAKMSEAEVVEAFCRPTYRVAFLGFTAGFPYLIGLPKALELPRLTTPRVRVPAGSVALAAGICGIYPRPSPGGWRVLGKTSADVFNPTREPAALFAPGDRVRFSAVDSLDRAIAEVAA